MIPNIVIVLAIYCGLHLLYLVWTSKSIVYRCIGGVGIACIVLVAYSTLKSSMELRKELQEQQANLEKQQIQDVLDRARRVENEQLWNSLNTDDQREEYRNARSYGVRMSFEQYRQAFVEQGPNVLGLFKGNPKEAALFEKYERMRLHAVAQGGLLIENDSKSKDNPYGKVLSFERYEQLSAEKPTGQTSDNHK